MGSKRAPIATVKTPGLATSVQDLGRRGAGVFGLSRGGAADALSAAVANRALANAAHACVLECTVLGPELIFRGETQIAFAGGAVTALLDGKELAPKIRHAVAPGMRLRLGPMTGGARVYLAIAGGWRGEPFFGSCATHLTAGAGGYAGRVLQAGDLLYSEDLAPRSIPPAGPSNDLPFFDSANSAIKFLRVTPGPEWPGEVGPETFARLAGPFFASQDMSRMGIRLIMKPSGGTGEGNPLTLPSIKSGPVFPGTVQWPQNNAPILLLCDCQATGGYPRVMQVIEADLPLAGQVRPGDEVWFRRVTDREARSHRAMLKAQVPEIF
ncbi:MAG: biotin-dependent carboxyltransferase family protein [Pseudomonadota bacterium]